MTKYWSDRTSTLHSSIIQNYVCTWYIYIYPKHPHLRRVYPDVTVKQRQESASLLYLCRKDNILYTPAANRIVKLSEYTSPATQMCNVTLIDKLTKENGRYLYACRNVLSCARISSRVFTSYHEQRERCSTTREQPSRYPFSKISGVGNWFIYIPAFPQSFLFLTQ